MQVQDTEVKGLRVKALGSLDPLQGRLLGILCSQKCPGDLILKAFDTAKQLRDKGLTVVSGFHSPVERDIFDILLRGNQPVVMCLAKAIETYRPPLKFASSIEKGKLTIIAPDFLASEKRITKVTSETCNKAVVEICDQLLIVYAQEGGSLSKLISLDNEEHNKYFTLKSDRNHNLIVKGIHVWQSKI